MAFPTDSFRLVPVDSMDFPLLHVSTEEVGQGWHIQTRDCSLVMHRRMLSLLPGAFPQLHQQERVHPGFMHVTVLPAQYHMHVVLT